MCLQSIGNDFRLKLDREGSQRLCLPFLGGLLCRTIGHGKLELANRESPKRQLHRDDKKRKEAGMVKNTIKATAGVFRVLFSRVRHGGVRVRDLFFGMFRVEDIVL